MELLVEHVINAKMSTLVILIANPVTVKLITQLELYVIKRMEYAHVWTDSVEEDVLIAMMDSSDILIALIVHADKTVLKITPTFVIEIMGAVLANPTMLAEPVMRVRMDTLIILVVKIVDALQIIPTIHLMSVIKEVANAPVLKSMMVEYVMNAKMATLVILIANHVTVFLITQLKQYVIKMMENAYVWKNLVEEVVILAKMNFMNIPVAVIVDALQIIP